MSAVATFEIDQWAQSVTDHIGEALAIASSSSSELHRLLRVLGANPQAEIPARHRLLPLAIHGALTGDPSPAVSVCVVSTLWWAGAELLDDLADQPSAANSVADMVVGIACLSAVPQLFIESLGLPAELRSQWSAELSQSSLRAAEGQIGDLAREPASLTWQRVMVSYSGKTGAAYERDAAMTCQLVGLEDEQTKGWRAFGRVFGVLRQLSNDHVHVAPELDEDLANGTPTLLLAHALGVASPGTRLRILQLRQAALRDLSSREGLRRLLNEPEFQEGYRQRLLAMRREAGSLLDLLTDPSEHRELIHFWIDAGVAASAG
jgi:hypothetical protein